MRLFTGLFWIAEDWVLYSRYIGYDGMSGTSLFKNPWESIHGNDWSDSESGVWGE